jgi:hypothetical protein
LRCPFVQKHYGASNMQKLQKNYTAKGVVWLTICSSAPGKQGYFEGQDLIARVAAEKSKASAYLVDADGKVGKSFGAKTTPHMYIIDPEGVLRYAGAIDDKPSVNPEDIPKAVNYVQIALDALMAGQEVEIKSTQSYGCSVKY